MPKRLYITLGIAVSGILLLVWYQQLGGFSSIEISLADKEKTYLVGKSYEGFPTDKRVVTLMDEVRQYLVNGTLKGRLSVTYFGDPDQNREPITLFVGIETSPAVSESLPEGLEERTLSASKVVRATLSAYSVVSPNPDQINEELREWLAENAPSYTAGSVFMERYREEAEIWTEIYVVEK